jgi:hypothetical protein
MSRQRRRLARDALHHATVAADGVDAIQDGEAGPGLAEAADVSMDAWPFESTNRSRLGQIGSSGSNRMTRFQSV